jgi:hypothetical protein
VPTFGQTLTANDGTWAPDPVVKSYQWLRDGNPIANATGGSYQLAAADVDKKIALQVTGSKEGHTPLTKTSAATAAVAALPLTGSPAGSIPATSTVGQTLTVVDGSWTPAPVELLHQWFRNNVAITDATTSSYTLVEADLGKTVTVKTTGTKPGYTTVTSTSNPSVISAGTLTNSALPSVSGTATVGQTLNGNVGVWGPDPVATAVRWLRNGTAISGATGSSYALTSADQGSTLSFEVTGTKGGYAPLTRVSGSTAAVTAPAVVVPPAPPVVQPPAVVKVNPSIKISGKGAKKKVTLTITVKGSGVTPTGKITIKLGNKKLKTVTLKNGKATVVLTKQKKGKRAYKVTYAGDVRVNTKSVTSKKIKIK